MLSPINFSMLAQKTSASYENRVIASVNDHEIHLSVMTAPYAWHTHPSSDETFIVVEGALVIGFEEGDVVLQAGEMLTVPAGVRHCTRPDGGRSVNLTVEKKGNETIFAADPAK